MHNLAIEVPIYIAWDKYFSYFSKKTIFSEYSLQTLHQSVSNEYPVFREK